MTVRWRTGLPTGRCRPTCTPTGHRAARHPGRRAGSRSSRGHGRGLDAAIVREQRRWRGGDGPGDRVVGWRSCPTSSRPSRSSSSAGWPARESTKLRDHYYETPGNSFWESLHLSGLSPGGCVRTRTPWSPGSAWGSPTSSATGTPLGRDRCTVEKLERWRPDWVAFTSKTVAHEAARALGVRRPGPGPADWYLGPAQVSCSRRQRGQPAGLRRTPEPPLVVARPGGARVLRRVRGHPWAGSTHLVAGRVVVGAPRQVAPSVTRRRPPRSVMAAPTWSGSSPASSRTSRCSRFFAVLGDDSGSSSRSGPRPDGCRSDGWCTRGCVTGDPDPSGSASSRRRHPARGGGVQGRATIGPASAYAARSSITQHGCPRVGEDHPRTFALTDVETACTQPEQAVDLPRPGESRPPGPGGAATAVGASPTCWKHRSSTGPPSTVSRVS